LAATLGASSAAVGEAKPAVAPYVAKIGAGSGISFASFLRFWAVAANRNSPWLRSGHGGAIDRA
jgi:hypothetical protein